MTPTPDEPERRKDVNTRKVIEVLREHMDEQLAGVVKYERLIYMLAAAALTIVSAAWVVTTMAVSRAEAAASSAKEDVQELRQDSGAAIQLVRQELSDTRTDIRALYQSHRTNRPQARLATPVPALPPNPITPPPQEK
jgi:hypothetical protein